MATCRDISFQPTPETDNFIRFTRLLIKGGTPIMRDVLKHYYSPESLITDLETRKIYFTKPEKQKVHPLSGLPNFEEFDISLIFKLLRNCCGLTEPMTKWDEMPQESDCSLEADIVRINVYRNQIYAHKLEDMALTNADFKKYWDVISDALCRLADKFSGGNSTLKDKIKILRDSPLTSEDRRIVEEHLRDIKSILAHQDERLKNIETKEEKMKQMDSSQRNQLASDPTSPKIHFIAPVMNITINQSTPNPRNELLECPPGTSRRGSSIFSNCCKCM